MDTATLVRTMPGLSPGRAAQLVGGANQAMIVGAVTSQVRADMFLSQIGHESVSLQYTEEIGGGAGHDYYPYCGRTFIQITWDYNYAAFGAWLHGKGLLTDPAYFVRNPARLADLRWAWLGAIWFWTTHGLNKLADTGDVAAVTQRINGGQNGYDNRLYRYNLCRSLGDAVLPTNSEDPLMGITLSQIVNGVAGLKGINRLTKKPATLVQYLDQINFDTYMTRVEAQQAAAEQTALLKQIAANTAPKTAGA